MLKKSLFYFFYLRLFILMEISLKEDQTNVILIFWFTFDISAQHHRTMDSL